MNETVNEEVDTPDPIEEVVTYPQENSDEMQNIEVQNIEVQEADIQNPDEGQDMQVVDGWKGRLRMNPKKKQFNNYNTRLSKLIMK